MADYVRALRLLQYEGPRDKVEEQIRRSIHGTKEWGNGVRITAVDLDIFPQCIGDFCPKSDNREHMWATNNYATGTPADPIWHERETCSACGVHRDVAVAIARDTE